MKALSKVALISLVSSFFVFGTGCAPEGLPPGMSPEDVIKKALLYEPEISQNVFDMALNADLQGDVEGEHNELEGSMNISGTSNEEKSEMQVTFSIDGTMNEDGVKASLEIRANEDGVFVKIDKVEVSDKETQDMIDTALKEEGYLGEWVKLSFMTPEEVTESGYYELDYDEGDPLPFKNIQYVGITDIKGITSYHFTAEFDEETLLDMYGDTPEVEEFIKEAEITGDVYVAVDEMFLTGFAGNMKLDDEELNGTIDFSFMINPTTSNAVQTPSYEKELTEEDLSALMFGGAMVGPDMEMEFDEEMMMDMEDMDFDMEGMPEDFDVEEFEAALEELEAIQ